MEASGYFLISCNLSPKGTRNEFGTNKVFGDRYGEKDNNYYR